jgi:hypothetical protein
MVVLQGLEPSTPPTDGHPVEISSSPTSSTSSSSRSSSASAEIVKRKRPAINNPSLNVSTQFSDQARTDVQNSIRRLSRISMGIKRAGTESRNHRADSYVKWDREGNEAVDLTELFARYAARVVDEIPKASPVLKHRISQTIARRHNRILYRKDRQKKLAEKPSGVTFPQTNLSVIARGTANVTPAPSQSTPIVSSENSAPAIITPSIATTATTLVPEKGIVSSAMSETSSRSSKVSTISQALDIPKAPKARSGTYFLCPYCYIRCPAKDSRGTRWRYEFSVITKVSHC